MTCPHVVQVRMRCVDQDKAQRFAKWLRRKGVDVDGVVGADVLVPTSNPSFVWDVADAAHGNGFATASEAHASARACLDTMRAAR